MKRQITNVGIELTTRCHLSCSHCSRSELVSTGMVSSNRTITSQTFRRFSSFIRLRSRYVNLSAGLGEPFLLRGLRLMIHHLKEMGHSPYMYTSPHNILQPQRPIQLFQSGLEELYVSVDIWHLNLLFREFGLSSTTKKLHDSIQKIREQVKHSKISANVVIDLADFRKHLQALLPIIRLCSFQKIEIKWRYPCNLDLAEKAYGEVMSEMNDFHLPVLVQKPLLLGECSEVHRSIYANFDGHLRICCADRNWIFNKKLSDYDCVEDFQDSLVYNEMITKINSMSFPERCYRCPNRVISRE